MRSGGSHQNGRACPLRHERPLSPFPPGDRGAEAGDPDIRLLRFAMAAGSATKMPDCLFKLVKTMSTDCKNYARGGHRLKGDRPREEFSVTGLWEWKYLR